MRYQQSDFFKERKTMTENPTERFIETMSYHETTSPF